MSEEEEYNNRPYILSDSEEEVTENGFRGPRKFDTIDPFNRRNMDVRPTDVIWCQSVEISVREPFNYFTTLRTCRL